MSKKKESIFSKIFKSKKSSCCCSMEIIEEPDKAENGNKEEKQAKNKED